MASPQTMNKNERVSDERLAELLNGRTALALTVPDFLSILTELQSLRPAREAEPVLPQDVIDLVIAARIVAFEDQSPEALRVLDVASEAFASRVPWDGERLHPSPSTEGMGARLPDNLLSHRASWLNALERLIELELESTEPDMDEKGYWRHEHQAMLDMYADLDALSALSTPAEEVEITDERVERVVVRPEIKSETEILKRLADGDEITFSQDGDDAFFVKGDRASVGRVILSMRSKGYLKRIVTDDENYRGMSERDVISDAGRAALTALSHPNRVKG